MLGPNPHELLGSQQIVHRVEQQLVVVVGGQGQTEEVALKGDLIRDQIDIRHDHDRALASLLLGTGSWWIISAPSGGGILTPGGSPGGVSGVSAG